MAVTDGLYVLLGYQPEDGDIPLRVDLLAGIPGIALFLIPCVAAVLFGGRATRAGDRWGLIPATVGALAGLWFTIMSLVTIFAG